MSAINSFAQRASCRCITRVKTTRPLQVRSTLSFVTFPRQSQRPFSSGRSTPNLSNTVISRRKILLALPALCLLGFAYKQTNPEFSHPLALDAAGPYERGGADPRLLLQYEPAIRAPTIEEINDSLRWEEGSRCIGPPSDVLRLDTVRVPSNNPCEDDFFAISVPDSVDENLRWIMWGVFDGHA